jgi:hypothetical protein
MQQVYMAFPSSGLQWFFLWRSVMDPVVGIEHQVRLAAPGWRGFRNAGEVGGEGIHAISRLHLELDHIKLQEVLLSNGDWTSTSGETVVAGSDAFLTAALDIPC